MTYNMGPASSDNNQLPMLARSRRIQDGDVREPLIGQFESQVRDSMWYIFKCYVLIGRRRYLK